MGVFAFLSYSSPSTTPEVAAIAAPDEHKAPDEVSEHAVVATDLEPEPKPHESVLKPALPITPSVSGPIPTIIISKPSAAPLPSRRFSLPVLPLLRSHPHHEHPKKSSLSSSFFKRATRISSSDKRAKKSALVVRALIIGPSSSISPSQSTPASPKLTLTSTNARPKLNKLKTQLLQPKSANKLIAQLRVLPEDDHESSSPRGPIHAVCLEHADVDEDRLHFSVLTTTTSTSPAASRTETSPIDEKAQPNETSFFDAPLSLDAVTDMLSKMNIVSLIGSPGLGLGEPGDGDGLLAGAVPTAETVLKGFEQITPQLMALGYATGKSVWIDHQGVYPPTDRMTILTYWWGMEIVLPPPSLKNLAQAKSIAGTVVNFLTALSLINNGVREILPFVRYIAQFIDFEFNTINSQDRGQGVICASTWIMPAALVPRPWDFPLSPNPIPDPTPSTKLTSPPSDPAASTPEAPVSVALPVLSSPLVPTDSPQHPVIPLEPTPTPPSLPTFADSIVGAYADSVVFQPGAAALGPTPIQKLETSTASVAMMKDAGEEKEKET
ncbi:hypothetical protein H0H87_009747 [Tephrocybe sp. NHM501043]|nr:hypothetical protein H0H87_009747 [Tephrocybe sp. NHM501043]